MSTMLIEVGEPIKVIKPAPTFKRYIIRAWSGGHGWIWWKGWEGRGDICAYSSLDQAREQALEIAEKRGWNPVLIFPLEYKGED